MLRVYVRARDETGKWGSAEITDLSEDSFRRFIGQILCECQILCGLISEDELVYETKKGFRFTD